MADIDKVLAEELPPDSVKRIAETPATYNVSEAIGESRPRTPIRGDLKPPFPPGVSANPGGVPSAAPGRYTLTRALKEELTIGEAKRIARSAIELAADGSPRHMEFVRDSIEGKPGVRITDGEWDPAGAAVFQQMMALRAASLVGQPQTEEQYERVRLQAEQETRQLEPPDETQG